MMAWFRKIRNVWGRNKRRQKMYAQFIRPNALVFDVGANHGQYASFFLQLKANVIAIEPQPSCWSDLEKLVDQSTNLLLVKSGLGAEVGTGVLYLGNMDEVSSLSSEFREAYSRYAYLNWEKTIDVPVTTIDALIAAYGIPDFCKIDTEGWEVEVLKGLSSPIPALSIEYASLLRHKAVEAIERLSEIGVYEFNFSAYENYRWYFKTWQTTSEIKKSLLQLDPKILHGDIFARLKM
jgi:FkbM family methyltransferase